MPKRKNIKKWKFFSLFLYLLSLWGLDEGGREVLLLKKRENIVAIIAILAASVLFGMLFQFLVRLGIIIAIVAHVAISAVGAIVAIDAIVAIVPLFGQTCLQYHGNWKVSTENRRQTSFAQFCYLQLNPISFSFQAIAMALEDSFSSLIH